MIDLWYLNVKSIDEQYMKVLLKFLPQEMIKDILRFQNIEDQRLKLLGKLMVKKYHEDKNIKFNWLEWQVSPYGKPHCNSCKKFNISHSKNYVAVAFSDHEIGIDIEKITDFDITSILNYLHPLEVEYVKNAPNPKDIFFKIWTRKEAYLKAIGKGIIDGINNENCVQNELSNREKWYLHSLPIIPTYQMALCTKISTHQINCLELFPIEFHN